MKQNYHTCLNYPKVKYKICQTWKDIKLLVKYIKETGWCVYDYETNGQMPYEPEAFPTVLGIAFQPYFTYVIPLEAVDSPFKGQTQKIHDYLNDEVFMNPKVIKVAHNMKFENTWLRRYGCDQRGITICTLLLKYTLDEERPMGLKENVARFFPEYANYEDDNARVVAKYGGWGNIPAEELAPYNALDCHVTFLLLNRLMASLLKTKTLIPLFKNLLMPLSELIAQTELKGAHVDVEYLLELDKKYRGLIEENQKKLNNLKPVRKFNKINRKVKVKKLISTIKAEIQELEAIIEEENDQTVINRKLRSIDARNEKIRRYKMGEFTTKKEIEAMGDLNFNSPNQMRDFLYGPNGLDLPIIRYTKDKKTKEESDNASTAEETLLELKEHDKYGFIDALLKHRGLTKLHSTTIAGVIERLSSNNRVHPRFLIHGTVCVSGDTIITGIESDFKIGDIIPSKPGDYPNLDPNLRVLTHTGKFELVTRLVNKGKHPMIRVQDDFGNYLDCTPAHRIYTELGWVPVTEAIDKNLWIIHWDTSYLPDKTPSVKAPNEELILPIPEWPGYHISNLGEVYSSKKPGARGELETELKPMSPRITKGYRRVGLRSNDGRKHMKKVAHLVIETFIGPKPHGMVVDHIDGNRLNDSLNNLQYISRSTNIRKAYKQNRNSFTKGNKNGQSRLTLLDIAIIKIRGLANENHHKIAEDLNSRQGHISSIIRGERHSHIKISKLHLVKSLGEVYVYDITVANDASYITKNGFINHNTGRFSSQNPNFQNFPRATTNADIKKQFAAPPGFLILEGDFSQAELRVAAELSDDDAMIDIFQRGYNIHFATAVKVFDDMDNYEELYKLSKDESWEHHDMWIKRKKKAKTINFGILYGQGAKMLAEGMGVDIDEAKEFIKEWYAAFPKLTKWIKKQKRLAHKNGYVENLFGRKRRLYDLLESGEDWKIAEAERLAVNTPIQGASSDFTQLANLTVQREIRRANIPFNTVLWNTVHDSIIFYIKPQFIHRVVPIIHNIAIQPETQRWFGFEMKKVPMKFSFEVGKTWGELHEYDPNEDYTKWVDNYYNKYNTKLHYGIVE